MKISDLIKMGLRNLSRRKARTALTVLGVVIGTISIVVMISIGVGMDTNFTKQMMELGSLTAITVNQYADIKDEQGNYVDSQKQRLDESLLNTIKAMEHVKAVTPVYNAYIQIYNGKLQTGAQVVAMDLNLLDDFGFPPLTYGEYPKEGEDAILFGASCLENMYNPNTRYGRGEKFEPGKGKLVGAINDWEFERDWEIEEKKFPIKEYGIMELTNSYEGYDWSAYMDINVFKKQYAEFVKTLKKTDRKKAEKAMREYDSIKIVADNVKNVSKIQEQIKDLGYQTTSLNSLFEPTIKTSKMLRMVLGAIGFVSMLVSAISIANTMVMSIYERTKEIGVMKVLGCIIKDIRKLFLFEAGLIGLIGGIIGIACSYLASFLINKFGGSLFAALMSSGQMFGQQTATQFSIIPLWLPLVAAAIGTGVGLLSGYFPARRATKISAIEAMKSEG